MFFYDHAMSRDDFMDTEPAGELDIMDGLRAMSMFKRDAGPLRPSDLNQDIKYALAENSHCIDKLYEEGFLDDSLIRELEQMMESMPGQMMDMPQMYAPDMIIVTKGMIKETGGPGKSKKKKNIPTNPKLYARVKAAAKRKFKVYPSAYANAWLVREYKKRGGGYRKG
jgi:hypothetical protein|tara:strand:- start:16 stop:519 length:504 start_codon:yes stop_codon:yes gene_type:complete